MNLLDNCMSQFEEKIVSIVERCLSILDDDYTLRAGSLSQVASVVTAFCKLLQICDCKQSVDDEKIDSLSESLIALADELAHQSKSEYNSDDIDI